MDLPSLKDFNFEGKKVLLRLDLDCEPDPNDLRIKAAEETLAFLKEKQVAVIVIGHKGRPEGKIDENLSLKPFQPIFARWGAKIEENLRFNPGEEANDLKFTQSLAALGDFYVNEAFGNSHRAHASIVGLPRLLPNAAGFRFVQEVKNLGKVLVNPKRPVVFILGGVKKDKLDFLNDLKNVADLILIGGRLPDYLGDMALESIRLQKRGSNCLIANLVQDKEDITVNSVGVFEEEIKKAGTIVLAGPMGKYEDEGHRQGTERVFKAVAHSAAFKVVGGGDSLEVVKMFNLVGKFDWVSVGGGAMLELDRKSVV